MQRARVVTTGWSGGPGLYTFYSQGSGTEDATTAQDLVDALDDVFLEIQSLFPGAWTATPQTFVDTITVGTGAITATDTVTGWSRTGGSSAGWGALAVGGCVTWLTDTFLAGRRLKGRTFVSPTASEFVDTDGTPKSSMVTALNSMAAAWVGALGVTSAPVVWHRPVGGSGGANSPITAASVKDKFAVLRSRRD
jgi:hypothetical protein